MWTFWKSLVNLKYLKLLGKYLKFIEKRWKLKVELAER